MIKKVLRGLRKRSQKYFGTKKYNKFIVVTRSRTGSNLLISLLNAHPNIEAYGELFGSLKKETTAKKWADIFSNKFKNIKYVGFKIFYYHPIDSDDKSVWDIIEKDRSIKIIHLRRTNMLRTYISKQIALKTNVWSTSEVGKSTKTDKRIEVDVEDCLADFENVRSWGEKTSKQFEAHDLLELTYEEMIKDNGATMNEVFEFLGVAKHPVKSILKKQNPEALKDIVSNFEELKSALTMAGYSNFFEE